MRIFLAGATGAIGKRLVPQLIANGHHVTATTRSAAKVEALRALGAEPVVVDGLDAVAVDEAVARSEPEAIIHQMTALAGTPDMKHFDRWFATTNELRTRGTEHLLAAAQAARVERFIAQSYTNWTNIRDGDDECRSPSSNTGAANAETDDETAHGLGLATPAVGNDARTIEMRRASLSVPQS